MSRNVAEGKAEAIVDLRGPSSLPCRQNLHGPCRSRVAITFLQLQWGEYLAQGARYMTGIFKTCCSGPTHFGPIHRTKIFGNAGIDLSRRVALYRTTSILLTDGMVLRVTGLPPDGLLHVERLRQFGLSLR